MIMMVMIVVNTHMILELYQFGILVPQSNLCSLQWKQRVLTNGPAGNFNVSFLILRTTI